MFSRTAAKCPVCGAILGLIVRGEICSFPCVECRWIFSWDGKGRPLKPVRMDGKEKLKHLYCGPEGCVCRD